MIDAYPIPPLTITLTHVRVVHVRGSDMGRTREYVERVLRKR